MYGKKYFEECMKSVLRYSTNVAGTSRCSIPLSLPISEALRGCKTPDRWNGDALTATDVGAAHNVENGTPLWNALAELIAEG